MFRHETRALDEHIKNLPKGQMEILMTDDTRGTLHAHLHVRLQRRSGAHFEPRCISLKQSAQIGGAHLRFKSAEFTRSDRKTHALRTTNMKWAICSGVLMIVLFFVTPSVKRKRHSGTLAGTPGTNFC